MPRVADALIDDLAQSIDRTERYPVTPAPIARWVAEIPEVELTTLPRLSFHEIIDSEIVDSATRQRS
jgi:hypothetical protein